MSRADRWLGAILVLVSLVWLWLVQREIPDIGAGWPGPRGLPQLLGVALALLGLALAAARAVAPRADTPPPAGEPHRGWSIALLTFAMLVAYAYLLDKIGFLPSAVALMAVALAGVLRLRRWVFIAGFAVAFSLGCWIVFSALLGIPLPPGAWLP